ncbi:hypothetical protein [Oleidesulfovibrio sp.]|uniref:hypothetical protein n=1 Tax=Oleidesulfovibrio sp. TaxID=2909707 RepID=UPI003A8B2E22
MKRLSVLSPLVAVLALLMLLTGCNGDPATDTYKTLRIAGVTYDATMQAAGDAYRSGHLTDEQKDTLIKYGTAFYGAWHTAREALEVYVETKNPDAAMRDRLLSLGTAALTKWTTFRDYARDMGVLIEGGER